jgi:DNA-binding response OmpR family regulator
VFTPQRHGPVQAALLVVGDDVTRQMYAAHLRGCGYAVEEASDGREALVKALTDRPDVMVTDTRLLGIDGCDLCAVLRTDTATRHTAILALVDDASSGEIGRVSEAGADAVLVSPCDPDELHAEMQRLLRAARDAEQPPTSAGTRLPTASDGAGLERHESSSTKPMLKLSHSHGRYQTTNPPRRPPALVCPLCDGPLAYKNSHVGGVSARHAEQWDYYECTNKGCGSFQYRQRTRRLRAVAS